MKILLINNFYYNRGGDCTYLFSLKNLLEKKGHEVIVFSMQHPENFNSDQSEYFVSYISYPDELKNIGISAGFDVLSRAVYSLEAKMKIDRLIEDERPDIAHVQNIHHHITPSIFYSLKRNNIPIIWTLHDFTVICPNTSFLAHGRVCEKCKKRRYFWPLLTRCKKNSFSASTMAAIESILHRVMQVNDLIDIFITPSRFLKNKLIEYGFREDNIICMNSFINVEVNQANNNSAGYYLYIGRLSQEKGIKTLINSELMANSGRLKIIGDGPLKKELISYVKSKSNNNTIEFLGHLSHEHVMELIKECSFIVLPTECYENFPYSVLEAFACGKPVIASRIGGIPEIVKNWETGLLFEPGNSESLYLKIKFFLDYPKKAEEMGKVARKYVERELSVEKYYGRLIDIYSKMLARYAPRKTAHKTIEK